MRSETEHLFDTLTGRASQSLGGDFSGIRLDRQPAAAIGGLARTIGAEVSLAHEATELPTGALSFILAHELAHVAQKRLGAGRARGADAEALEDEADAVAAAILAGRTARCLLADQPARPAYWGELGHYYTSYYVMLMAGVPPKQARLRAFFCQLPDEVWQFDATAATRDIKETAPADADYGAGSYAVAAGTWFADIKRATPDADFVYQSRRRTVVSRAGVFTVNEQVEDPVAKAARLHRDLNVIRGLHCLTGEASSDETFFRLKVLLANWQDPVLSGLALHPFGDSYAHRTISDTKAMYGDDHGHLFDMHTPDYISSRPDNYIAYARALYQAIPGQPNKPPFAVTVEPTLRSLTEFKRMVVSRAGATWVPLRGEEAEEKGYAKMKEILSRTPGYDGSYEPEKEGTTYWSTFAPAHKAMLDEAGGADAVRTAVMNAGMRWNERKV